MPADRQGMFSTPAWLRDVGFASWLLVGVVLIIIGVIWLLSQSSTIVMPVIMAAVLGAVTTAWASYQSARWRGDQAKASGASIAARVSRRAANVANRDAEVDLALFTQWVDLSV